MLSKVSKFATYTFLVWMLIAAVIGFIFPMQLSTLSSWVPYLLGIVMVGMGLTIDPKDFKIVFHAPRSVIIGVVLQYTIMTLTAFLIAILLLLPQEVAIAVILVVCCHCGTSSIMLSY